MNPDGLVTVPVVRANPGGKMLRTIEAVIEADGRVRLLEPVELTTSHRALVTVLEESGDDAAGGSLRRY